MFAFIMIFRKLRHNNRKTKNVGIVVFIALLGISSEFATGLNPL